MPVIAPRHLHRLVLRPDNKCPSTYRRSNICRRDGNVQIFIRLCGGLPSSNVRSLSRVGCKLRATRFLHRRVGNWPPRRATGNSRRLAVPWHLRNATSATSGFQCSLPTLYPVRFKRRRDNTISCASRRPSSKRSNKPNLFILFLIVYNWHQC